MAVRRRENNLTLESADVEESLTIEPTSTPWMSRELFDTLWLESTHQASSSCTFTPYKNCSSAESSTSSSPATDNETPEYTSKPSQSRSTFRSQLLSALGSEIIEVPSHQSQASDKLEELTEMLYAYASVSDDYGLETVFLIRLERLRGSEQVAITVKNTDPAHPLKLSVFLGLLQQRIQPELPPSKPHAFVHDTNDLFFRSESSTKVGSSLTLSSRNDLEPMISPQVTNRSVSKPTNRGRMRSHTIRYRSEEGIAFEGYLSKKSDVLVNWKTAYCVLEGDALGFYESREDFISNSKLIGRILVQKVENDSSGKPNGFRVVTDGGRTTHLSSRTAFEKQQWKRALKNAMSKHSGRPRVAFGSQALNPHRFYELLGSLLKQDVIDFPLLFQSVHPDVVLTSNYPPIVPFWGQYRRYDGLLLYFSTLLETVSVETFQVLQVSELVRDDVDCVDAVDDGVYSWEKRLVITGKETLSLLDFEGRNITQLFVHELWLDHKDRLVRWHLNGDSVALSLTFDDAPKGENIRLVLPGEASSIDHAIPPGVFYVQVLRAQHLQATGNGVPVSGKKSDMRVCPLYVRAVLVEGTHEERTLDGLDLSSTNGKRPSKGTRLFRGLKRATGISGQRTHGKYGDPSGCVTRICKCPLPQATKKKVEGLDPEWRSDLRLEFPGCSRGFTYYLKLEVFQSRFMLPDELVGVSRINLTPHLSLFNASAEAVANGALARWHNLSDQYNDCRESWAPPTVFRGRIQVSVVFAPTVTSAKSLSDLNAQEGDESHSMKLGDGRRGSVARSRSTSHLSSKSNAKMSRLDMLTRDNHTLAGKRSLFDVPTKYEMIKVVGAGTYGEVMAASDTESGEAVAIKKISNAFQDLPDTKRILRELCLLKQLHHPNIIQLFDVLRPERRLYLEDLYLVTDLMETDLHRVVHSTQTLTDEHVAFFMRQILRALAYMHSANILHRDLKPSNILVTSNCELRVADMGLARYVDRSQAKTFGDQSFVPLTEYVVTRWYRSPEILLDGCRYDTASDMWSAGCILAELLGRKPLFPGSSTMNQLDKIFNVLGTPSTAYVNKIHKEAARKWAQRQRKRRGIPLASLYPSANTQAIDLVSKLLVYDPDKRLTAKEALRHPYMKEAFRSMRADNMEQDEWMEYSAAEEEEDTFRGVIDDSHESVEMTKSAMQDAVFERICHFHPEALEYEEVVKEQDEQFCVSPESGKLVPIRKSVIE